MKYDIYQEANNDLWRFALGRRGRRKLLTIGLNPSTATNEKSDTTVAKVEGVARQNGFDGFVMLNLYPVRSKNFQNLPVKVETGAFAENLKCIEELVASEPKPVIWVAWGENILARDFFVAAAREIFARLQKYGSLWRHFGSLTASDHPRHPSRLSYEWKFSTFDTKRYMGMLDILMA
jgi:hypothetical protein